MKLHSVLCSFCSANSPVVLGQDILLDIRVIAPDVTRRCRNMKCSSNVNILCCNVIAVTLAPGNLAWVLTFNEHLATLQRNVFAHLQADWGCPCLASVTVE